MTVARGMEGGSREEVSWAQRPVSPAEARVVGQARRFLTDNTGLKYNMVIKETQGLPCEAQENLSCHKVGWMLSRACKQAK